jgi:carnitine O-acetyltransferase
VPSKEESVLVFGPVVPDGYGLCYNPQESQIIFGVSAFNNNPETDSIKMGNSVRQFTLIGYVVSEEKILRNQPTRNKNCI